MILGSASASKNPRLLSTVQLKGARARINVGESLASIQQCDAKQEGHPDGGEVPVRCAVVALVESVGVDHCMSDREQARALVMIDDDDVELSRMCLLERLERLRPAVDAYGDARALRL